MFESGQQEEEQQQQQSETKDLEFHSRSKKLLKSNGRPLKIR